MKVHEEKVILPQQASFVCYREKRNTLMFNWHHHPEYELTCIQQGQGKRFVGDHIHDFDSTELVLLGSNLPHTWYSTPRVTGHQKPCEVIVIQFAPHFLGKQTFSQPEFCHVRELLHQSACGLQFTGKIQKQIIHKMNKMGQQPMLSRLVNLFEILDQLGRSDESIPLSSAAYWPHLPPKTHRRIDLVCQHIEKHFHEPLAQRDIARLVHLTPAAFSRFFKKSTGKPFIQYVREIRIGKACQLLIETDLSIMQVGYECGFGNLSNFNRCFLKHKQMSPGVFRKRFSFLIYTNRH